MALITTFISGCYVDGTCEVFAVYNNVTNILQDIVVKGDSSREVDVVVDGETVEIGKHNLQELKFNHSRRNLRFFIPPIDDDITPSEIPRIICTYYAEKLSRTEIISNRLAELNPR